MARNLKRSLLCYGFLALLGLSYGGAGVASESLLNRDQGFLVVDDVAKVPEEYYHFTHLKLVGIHIDTSFSRKLVGVSST